MKFMINGKEQGLKFGMLFLQELDNRYTMKMQGGMEFSMGMKFAIPYLKAGNITALWNVLSAALKPHGIKPYQVEKEIERIAETDAEEGTDKLGELFEELLEEMGKQPLLRKEFSQLEAAEAQVKAEQNA